MENVANLLLGTVLIFSLVALSALVLMRGKRRRKLGSRPAPMDANRPGGPADPVQTEGTGLFERVFGIFRRGKKGEQSLMPGGVSALTDFGTIPVEDPAQISEGGLAGETLSQDQDALLAAVTTDAPEQLTTAEADAFRALTGGEAAEGADGQSGNEDGSPSDSDGDKAFDTMTLDNTLEGAFKTARIVDTKREALLARVPFVDSQDLVEEIKNLATRIKVYVPDEPAS
ncbi:MAG: hypothetical protein J4O03_00390 [Chloroflexi bacterium]|nr:hypothetical protein [Chloroflexota bacterium]MCI0791895.1 hypothetical protein [Chloroflexota bacterium]MCI0797659.1 hypothetical protein [Chloroflexota bacterium]MCI0823505.1 hypothetical protein [Chloroflexota bacterium]